MARRQPMPEPDTTGEPLRFVSIRLDELLSMSPAEVDYLDALPSDEHEEWLDLWRSVREVAR